MKPIAGCLLVLALLVMGMVSPLLAAELTLDLGHGTVHWSTAALLARADVQTIHVPADVAFRRPMRYRAIPLADLLRGIVATDHLQFVGADGFAAEIPATLILNQLGSEAWLEIEDTAPA